MVLIRAIGQPTQTTVFKPWLKQTQKQWPAITPPQRYPQQGYSLPRYDSAAYSYRGQSGGVRPARRPPPPAPPGFRTSPDTRFHGTVSFYHKQKGFGFIDCSDRSVAPNGKVFVHWKNIESDDRFPFLVEGLDVEFSVLKVRDMRFRDIWTLRANNVTLVGGTRISLQDDIDAQTKRFVGGQHLRYTGRLKFFNPRRGFGYVEIHDGYDIDPSVPSDLRVLTAEVNAGGMQPMQMQDIEVEFGIFSETGGRRGDYFVYNMTLPGGHPLTRDALENRTSIGSGTFSGEVAFWNLRGNYGFIRIRPGQNLHPRVVAKLEEMQRVAEARARQRGKELSKEKLLYFRRPDCHSGFVPRGGARVTFQVYIDDKGAGACDVHDS